MSDTAPAADIPTTTSTVEEPKTVTEQASELAGQAVEAVSEAVTTAVETAVEGAEAIAEAVTGEKRPAPEDVKEAAVEKKDVSRAR